MHELIQLSIQAQGGLENWDRIRQVSATFIPDGIGLIQRGQEGFTKVPTRVTLDTKTQRTTFEPFLAPGQRGIFEPNRTAVQSLDGASLEELKDPRGSFKDSETWSATQLAYFAGYAMWTYLTLPFSLVMDGVECEEVDPYIEDGETWRALNVIFPESFVTHSREQTLYIDNTGILRRHDYSVAISNGAQAAHYLYDHRDFDGIVFPTKRRIYPRSPDLKPIKELLVFAADLDDFTLLR
jgi:hypothetical protein